MEIYVEKTKAKHGVPAPITFRPSLFFITSPPYQHVESDVYYTIVPAKKVWPSRSLWYFLTTFLLL